MANKIVLTFSGDVTYAQVNESFINIKINLGGGTIVNLQEAFRSSRVSNGQVRVPNPYDPDTMAANFSNAWKLDQIYFGFADINQTRATAIVNEVTITLNQDHWTFETPTGTAIDDGIIFYEIIQEVASIEKSVSIASYSQSASNYCENIDVDLEVRGGSETYNVYVNNVLNSSSQTSPFAITIGRGVAKSIRVVDDLGVLIGTVQTVNTRRLIEDDINITVQNYASGSTITVSVGFITSEISNYTYSLDGITYQTENVFTGQVPDNYTMYVKDGIGCVTTKDYVVDGVTEIVETIFDISEINPLRYSYVNDDKKNQLNTLSFNALRLTKYPFYHKFLATDTPTTQFKTNASYISCFKYFCDGTTEDLTVLKKTSNIGNLVKTTCTYYSLGNGQSAIYFGVVDYLDYSTSAVIREVNYGASLPQWANEKGKLVNIDGLGQVEVESITYSEEYSSFVAVFNIEHSGNAEEKIVSAIYNIQPYEIYEFETLITEVDFNVVIQVGTSEESIDYTLVSEKVKQVDDSDFLFEITYWDDENKGKFNYQTGVKNTIRLRGQQDSIGEQLIEGYNGDNEFYITNAEVYDTQKFIFNRVTTQIANKLRLVFSHKYLKINGLFYKLSEVPEVEGDGSYNLKNFVVTLKRGGDQFLTTEQETITDSVASLSLKNALESAKGKGILLWTKNL